MEQLLTHIFGDYICQTDWMAVNKDKKSFPCLIHAFIYTAIFLLLTTSWKALLVIGITHFILDRWHIIIKRIIWWKNHFPIGKYPQFPYCDTTGYYDNSPYNTKNVHNENWTDFNENERVFKTFEEPRPLFITMWLYIITDNFFHLLINFLALKYLV